MSSISTLIEASSSAAVLLGFFIVHVSPLAGLYSMREAIIGREGHWQSRILRNDLDWSQKSHRIRSLSGQLPQVRPLTHGSRRTISRDVFSLVISETCWRTRGDSNSR